MFLYKKSHRHYKLEKERVAMPCRDVTHHSNDTGILLKILYKKKTMVGN